MADANDLLVDDQVALGALVVVEASVAGCPERTLWQRSAERKWVCVCCGRCAETAELVDPEFAGCTFEGPCST